MKEKLLVVVEEEYVDHKGVGHSKGTIGEKVFNLAGECGYVDDAIGNLTQDEMTLVMEELGLI